MRDECEAIYHGHDYVVLSESDMTHRGAVYDNSISLHIENGREIKG